MIKIKINTTYDWVHRDEDSAYNTVNEVSSKDVYFAGIKIWSKTFSVDHEGNHEVAREDDDDHKMGFKR